MTMTTTAAFAALLVALYAALAIWTARRLRALRRVETRLGRLADGLALLTDTTESGLQTVIREVEQLRRPGPARASRTAVSRRVVRQAKQGRDVAAIAAGEAISESEVRLHLSMAEAAEAAGRVPGAARRPAAADARA